MVSTKMAMSILNNSMNVETVITSKDDIYSVLTHNEHDDSLCLVLDKWDKGCGRRGKAFGKICTCGEYTGHDLNGTIYVNGYGKLLAFFPAETDYFFVDSDAASLTIKERGIMFSETLATENQAYVGEIINKMFRNLEKDVTKKLNISVKSLNTLLQMYPLTCDGMIRVRENLQK